MKYKYINYSLYTILVLVISACSATNLRMGNSKYDEMAYSSAIPYYEKALKKEEIPYAMEKLADCYQKINNNQKAEEWYKKLVTLPYSKLKHPEHRIYLAHVLKTNEKYEEASALMKKYLEDFPGDPMAMNLLQYCDSVMAFKSDQHLYMVEELPLNMKGSSFSPTYYNKGLVFCSQSTRSSQKDEWTGSAFFDLYYSQPNDSGKYDKPVPLKGIINSHYHEGPACFSQDGNEVYFTRSHMAKRGLVKDANDINNVKLCKAKLIKDEWREVVDLPFNDPSYSTGHPSLSPDGKMLFFISDRPTGKGGTDIYFSFIDKGSWTKPENISIINTASNELFPFFYSKGDTSYLFFSSNGHPGLGGLDIYYSKYENGSFSKPVYMSAPINSAKDDFGFIINKEYCEGYLSSNRDNETGIDKIYHFRIIDPKFPIIGLVINKWTGKPVANADIAMKSLIVNNKMNSDNEGAFSFSMKKDESYNILAQKEGYIADSSGVSTLNKKLSEDISVKLALIPIQKVIGTVGVKGTQSRLSDVAVEVLNYKTGEKIEIKTDSSGTFIFMPAQESSYFFHVKKSNFYSASGEVSTIDKFEPETFKIDLMLEPIVLNKAIRMDDIYYDYNKWDIRNDAASQLDKLVTILRENPEIKIELSSHTDARGTDSYNLKLSQKRAESAVKYIISQNIDPKRIVAKGYGETKLLNDCKNGSNCSEEDHQYNRRTEFKVLKIIK